MGIKNWAVKKSKKVGDNIAKISALSPGQVAAIQQKREDYFNQLAKVNPNDPTAQKLTESLLAANSVEIYNAYLSQIKDLYVPIEKDVEYGRPFNPNYNIRYLNITKWVTDKEENSLEKLVNVYAVLADEECNIALVFHRTCTSTQVYLAITNIKNSDNNNDANNYYQRLKEAIRGNFAGTEWKEEKGIGNLPCLNKSTCYSVASATNIPTEKSEKFISQTIEKLLDGIIPENPNQEYTIILLATPIHDIEERKLRLAEIYSGLAPYMSWQTGFTYTESDSIGSSANFGVNAGVSAGVQNGQNQTETNTTGTTESTSDSQTDTQGVTESDSTASNTSDSISNTITDSTSSSVTETTGQAKNYNTTRTKGSNTTHTDTSGSSDTLGGALGVYGGGNVSITKSVGGNVGGSLFGLVNAGGQTSVGTTGGVNIGGNASVNYNHGWNRGVSDATGTSISDAITNGMTQSANKGVTSGTGHSTGETITKVTGDTISKSVANSTAKAITNTLGRAVTNSVAKTAGVFQSVNFGGNFGVNFARSSNVTATIGKNESITQTFTNYNIKHALELLEGQMERLEQSTALGMWDFAAYVLSEDLNIANNVAHSYLALTQGEKSYMTHTAVNVWRGDIESVSTEARMICDYLRELRHPVFGLNLEIINEEPDYNVYPAIVTATTSLSGKELAYSLNFPKKSVSGFPVIECAEFGRNVVTYDIKENQDRQLEIGHIFHMHHEEKTIVELSVNSFASHTFITGSTGVGKSNTVYKILEEARKNDIPFLVIEPAKGEYKHIFGNEKEVFVYGTNPKITQLLRINPFSFPKEIHVLEHLDRLIEIFNVCWPMYAAMPAVLKSAVEQSYIDCGWDLLESTNEYGDNLYPQFSDVARNIKHIIDSSEYDTENKGAYKGALLTRIHSLTTGINSMIFSNEEIISSDLFDKSVIVDLSRIGSSETKSLIMGMLVLKLQEYRMMQGEMNAPLKHLTVLEEAHHLLRRTSNENVVDGNNLVGKSVEMLSNAIAEMRTYGEGFIIADQSPELLDMSVIRNTNTKIIMRLPDKSDRELVGNSANLNEVQIMELAKLPCGVAVIYQNEWLQPVLCKVTKTNLSVKKYEDCEVREKKVSHISEDSIYIAELLSNGTKLNKEVISKDICPRLQHLKIKDSVQVAIIKYLLEPPSKKCMTKLASIITPLFPKLRETIEKVYSDGYKEPEWTSYVEQVLLNEAPHQLSDRVRRNIIQAVITDYILLELGKEKELKSWNVKGGLK